MKKKLLIIIVLLLLIIASIGFYLLWMKGDKHVEISKTAFQFEYGEVIKLDGKNVLNTEDNTILKSFSAEYKNLTLEEGKKLSKCRKL